MPDEQAINAGGHWPLVRTEDVQTKHLLVVRLEGRQVNVGVDGNITLEGGGTPDEATLADALRAVATSFADRAHRAP